MRTVLLLIAVLLAPCVVPPREAAAKQSNPYKAFNLSGINYAAQQWERDHSGSRQRTGSGRLFWRR